jgi:hypothetical protein
MCQTYTFPSHAHPIVFLKEALSSFNFFKSHTNYKAVKKTAGINSCQVGHVTATSKARLVMYNP